MVDLIIGLITSLLAIFIVFSKNITHILIGEIAINLMLAIVYGAKDGMSAAGISIIATVQAVVFYLYQRKNKETPRLVFALFLLIYAAWCIYTFKGALDLIPAVCILFFALAVMQKKPSAYRVMKMFNALFWIVYDVIVWTIPGLLTHVIVLAALVAAAIKLDRGKK